MCHRLAFPVRRVGLYRHDSARVFAVTAALVVYAARNCYADNPEMAAMKGKWSLVTLSIGTITRTLYILFCKAPSLARARNSSSRNEWMKRIG